MPRKQRFKPSRKPKPTPETPTQERVEQGGPSPHRTDSARAPDAERPDPTTDARAGGRAEEIEAR